MPQAKVFTPIELRRALDYVATRPHAARNRAMLLCSHWAGMRVKEIAALRYGDVLNSDGTVKEDIFLSAEQTKGRHSRTVYVNSKLQKELKAYVTAVPATDMNTALFYTQKENARGFTSNTLCQFFHCLYKKVGIEGASSHSGRRSFLTNMADKGTSIHILKTLAGHRSIACTAVYLYSSPSQLKKAVELV
jgi:integrase/recombinase XerD